MMVSAARPDRRWPGLLTAAALLAAVVASFAWLAIDLRALLAPAALAAMGRFVAEFFPPDLSPAMLRKVGA